MLIKNLGQTRTKLLESFRDHSDKEINQQPMVGQWSISQVVYHLYTTEKETAILILDSLKMNSKKVEERDLSFLLDRSKKMKAANEPLAGFLTKSELNKLLEESRFQYLQAIFNETHQNTLAEKSVDHPVLGAISLKNLVEYIWMHEKRHLEQISEIKQGIKEAAFN